MGMPWFRHGEQENWRMPNGDGRNPHNFIIANDANFYQPEMAMVA